MADEYVVESIDKKGIAGQRKTFLQTLQESCKNKVSVGIRFHGPGVEGLYATGKLIGIESSLDEVLVENLETPNGTLSVARVSLDDVLYIRILEGAHEK